MPPRCFKKKSLAAWNMTCSICMLTWKSGSARVTTQVFQVPAPMRSACQIRLLSSHKNTAETPLTLQPSRWLSDLRARIGKCILFGCTPAQITESATVLRTLAAEWRQLTAGSEGFLTGGRRGIEGQKVVWGEMDSFNHVNNVTYARYAESSRINWITSFALHADPGQRHLWTQLIKPISVGLILKSMTTEFKFPLVYPDTISVYHKLRSSPAVHPAATSILLDCMILSHRHQRIGARAFEDISVYDYRIASKTQLPAFMHNALVGVWSEQMMEMARARARIEDLTLAVERLEKKTWDRADAVEDLGNTEEKYMREQ